MAVINPWKIDPAQSKIAFKVGYMQLGVITGEFRIFDGFVECDEGFEEVRVRMSVDSRSVTTFHAERDAGMRAADVFDAEKHPLVYFITIVRLKSGFKNKGRPRRTTQIGYV
jgi:polyisoprenoid-binding protein YceI